MKIHVIIFLLCIILLNCSSSESIIKNHILTVHLEDMEANFNISIPIDHHGMIRKDKNASNKYFLFFNDTISISINIFSKTLDIEYLLLSIRNNEPEIMINNYQFMDFRKKITKNRYLDIKFIEFIKKVTDSVNFDQKNIYLIGVYEQIAFIVHITKLNYKEYDRELIDSIMHSIDIIDSKE